MQETAKANTPLKADKDFCFLDSYTVSMKEWIYQWTDCRVHRFFKCNRNDASRH